MNVIAVGRTSTVVEFGPNRVAKVLSDDVPDHWADAEAVFTDEVRRAGAAAPVVHDVTVVEGRPAIVFERIVGPSLWQAMLEEPDRVREYVELLVDVQRRINRIGPCPRLPSLTDRMVGKLADAEALDPDERTAAIELLGGTPRGAALLHGDLHPGNVLLGPDGPVAIDWFDASIGHPEADRARTALLLQPVGATDLRHLPGVTADFIERVAAIHRELTVPSSPGAPWARLVAASRLAERTDLDTSGLAATWHDGARTGAR